MATLTVRPPRKLRHRRAGMTLIEVLVAFAILMVAMLGLLSSLVSTHTLGDSNQESARAYQAARSMMEELLAEGVRDILVRYDSHPANDPDGPGTAPGPDFAVLGLSAQETDLDGVVGRVRLPLSPGGSLRENLDDADLGMPRDLNGDGVVDGQDHSDDFILLPIQVRVQWSGRSGDRVVEFSTLLSMRS